jgi:hypothetical protein
MDRIYYTEKALIELTAAVMVAQTPEEVRLLDAAAKLLHDAINLMYGEGDDPPSPDPDKLIEWGRRVLKPAN